MQIGKTDGKSFSFNFMWRYGFSFFVPETKHNRAISFGLGWRTVNGPKRFTPFLAFNRIGTEPTSIYCRMWHLRKPYNVVRIGEWTSIQERRKRFVDAYRRNPPIGR